MATTAYMIKSFGVMSLGKFGAVVGLIWGFLSGLILAVGFSGMGSMMGSGFFGIGAGIVGVIVMIIIGGIGGFISGAVGAIIYNIILGAIGGIEMDLELKA